MTFYPDCSVVTERVIVQKSAKVGERGSEVGRVDAVTPAVKCAPLLVVWPFTLCRYLNVGTIKTSRI